MGEDGSDSEDDDDDDDGDDDEEPKGFEAWTGSSSIDIRSTAFAATLTGLLGG